MGKKSLWAGLLGFLFVFVFFELTNFDMRLQQYFYLPAEKTWILKDPTLLYRKIFYTGIKIPLYITGVAALVAAVISWKKNIWHEHRKGFLIVALSLIILPTTIALVGKNASNVQCPDDLDRFAGHIPYVKHLEPYPPNPNSPDGKWFKGRCWPAGHASGGFALFSLVCLFRKKSHQWAAFSFAMAMGWTMGLYQMLRGAHFISHNLTTMFLAIILVSTLNILIKDFKHANDS